MINRINHIIPMINEIVPPHPGRVKIAPILIHMAHQRRAEALECGTSETTADPEACSLLFG